MTYVIWSNGGRFEYIVTENEKTVARSGLVFLNRAAAKRAMLKAIAA